MSIIGLDLGTSCGWAVEADDGSLHSGVWKLSDGDGYRTRWLTFWVRLVSLKDEYGPPTLIAFERVDSHGRAGGKTARCPKCRAIVPVKVQMQNTLAAHVYGALVGVVEMFADANRIKIESVPVGTLKKFATGDGRATKEDMIAYANMRWPEQNVGQKHDQADALHVLDWALVEVLKRRKKQVIEVGANREMEF